MDLPKDIVSDILFECMKTADIKSAFQAALVDRTSLEMWYQMIVPLRIVEIIRLLLPQCSVKESESPFLGFDKYIICDLSTIHRTRVFLDLLITNQIAPAIIWEAIKPPQEVMPLTNERVSVEFQLDNRDEETYDIFNPWHATYDDGSYGDTSDEDSSEPEEDFAFRDLLQTEKILTRFYDVIGAERDVVQVCVEVKQYQGIGFWTHRDE